MNGKGSQIKGWELCSDRGISFETTSKMANSAALLQLQDVC